MNAYTVLLALYDEDEGDAWIFMETVEAASPVEAIHVARETARASGGAGGKVTDAVVIEGSHQCLNPLPQGTDYGDTWPLDT